jgi:6-phosphogluconolactonase
MKSMLYKYVLYCVLATMLLLTSVHADSTRVYFGTSNSKGIYVSAFDSQNGTLSPPRLALEIGRPGFLTIHPNKRFVYSTTTGGDLGRKGGVAAMKINPDGTLVLLNKQSTDGRGPSHVSVDHSGRCLMVSYYGSGGVASFRILEDGSLSEAVSVHQHEGSAAHPKRQQGPHAHSIYPNPANTYAYAPDLGIDKVMIYSLDAKSAILNPVGEAPIPGSIMGPRHMKWSADGQYAYVLNELDLSISVFRGKKNNGTMDFIETVSTLPADMDRERLSCSEIRIHPNGRFIYAAIRDLDGKDRDSISVFTRFEDGFKRLETVPAEVWIPRNFNLDPSGQWLIAGGQRLQNLAVFKVDPETGRITFTGTTLPFEGGPICVEFIEP